MSRQARGNRAPGSLPLLLPRIDALAARGGSSKEVLAPVVRELRTYATQIDILMQRLWDGYLSYPALHGATHKGGADTLETTILPTPITLGAEAAIGAPQEGYASSQHVHSTEGLDFLSGLADLDVDAEDGIPVYDQQMRWLLEMILVETVRIRELSEDEE